ncbi:MAG TPA: GGDEF domain-containing protein [Xanthobacteraceae bacterium]|nr:GGDEF domain-containing protein [Xanthobacteraceae bacterium]
MAKRRLYPALAIGPTRSLRNKIWIGVGLVFLFTMFFAAALLFRFYGDYTKAQHDLHDLRTLSLVFEAANRLSAERGPANSVMGAEPTEHLSARLAEFRARSDTSFEKLSRIILKRQADDVPVELLDNVATQIIVGRTKVDAVATLPLAKRTMQQVQTAIESMFEIVDRLEPLAAWQLGELIRSENAAAGPAMQARMLGDLREFGGRIASQIMAPVAVRKPLPTANIVAVTRTRDRLLELWRLVSGHEAMFRSDSDLSAAWDDARTRFFGESLPLIEQVMEEGRGQSNYSMTAEELTNRFVPTLKPLETLRNTYLAITIERFEATRDRALSMLILITITAVVLIAGLCMVLRLAHTHILQPLLNAREQVINLAEDKLTDHAAQSSSAVEIQSLFDAIGILRRKLKERAEMSAQLKQFAETDSLTGFMNRRALDLYVQGTASTGGRMANGCLIMMDIDRFKSINDNFGHLAGDEVLVETSARLRGILRENDIIARFGGEEFVILLEGSDLNNATIVAQAIRIALQEREFTLSKGARLAVTASFGVAEGEISSASWRALIKTADKALYRAKSSGRNRVCVARDPAGPYPVIPFLANRSDNDAQPKQTAMRK